MNVNLYYYFNITIKTPNPLLPFSILHLNDAELQKGSGKLDSD